MDAYDASEPLSDQVRLLKTKVKHLSNELAVSQSEYETSTHNYFDIFSNMEQMVEERTRELKDLHTVLEIKSRELQIMIDSSPGIIFYKDLHGRYIRVNQKFVDAFKVPANQIIGKTHEDLFPKDAGNILNDDNTVINHNQPLYNQVGTLQGAFGPRTVRVDKIPNTDGDGKVIGYIGFALDVTELEKAEKENRRLHQRISQAEKLESIGTLAGGIAHNFNNILMAIQGYVSLLLLDHSLGDKHLDMLGKIDKQIRSGSRLTRQLLGYAREGRYEVTPISINALVTEIGETFGMTRKDITIKVDLDPDLSRIMADRCQIEQVFLNLFVNAADAMPSGGRLQIRTRNVNHTDIGDRPYTLKSGDYVEIEISDNGVGIDDDNLEHVFEPFFTTKSVGKGTGLGLASVYGTIKAHGGYVDVRSQVGQGTSFIIHLPTRFSSKNDSATEDAFDRSNKKVVLFVDDNKTIRDVGTQLLEAIGYTVMVACNGKEALDLYRNHQTRIDLVILDLNMPGMDGGETFDQLRGLNPDVKVMLASGDGIEGAVAEALQRGCNGYLQKPFNMTDLATEIRRLFDEDMDGTASSDSLCAA